MILILGAGIAGLSASHFLGHERCLVLEKSAEAGGHLRSTRRDGFVWDTGPHVSFTRSELVRALFSDSVGGEFEEFEARVGNYFRGSWIDHPAQTSLHQVPEPLRSACLQSFLETRRDDASAPPAVADYAQWLEQAFGPVFAQAFPQAYTRKYWTREAHELGTSWIGGRILYPRPDDVVQGSRGPLSRNMHYFSKVRYPRAGGYEAFAGGLRAGARIRFGAEVARIDLARKRVWLADGEELAYDQLVNTLPLPVFVGLCADVPEPVRAHARRLACTQLLLVNVAAPHPTRRPEHWLYVYDEDKLATRINFTERLSPANAPAGWTGVQAEVYFSRHKPLRDTPDAIAAQVERELVEMGLVDPDSFAPGHASHRHHSFSPWANVIFDHDTAPALAAIWSWLEGFGLRREADDLSPLTDWGQPASAAPGPADLAMAGRFGQWKYFWSDDCVLRGHRLAQQQA